MVKFAEINDIPYVFKFINELAEYEKMSDDVVADEEMLRKAIFEKHNAEALLVYEGDKPVGFALFYQSFSTFLGRAGIFLEDLYVSPDYRGRGYGKELLEFLAKTASDRKCGRLEWCCLDWNKSSVDFYKSMGAEALDDRTIFRLKV